MPGTYPAAAPTLSGDTLSISRFLQNPTQVRRRLRDFRDLRFVSDQILTQRLRSSGGAVLYEMSEPFVTNRTVEAVGPGSGYPKADTPTGTAALAAIKKWGQDTDLTDEEITRNVYAGQAIDRKLRKVVNSVISQVDAVTLSAVASSVTATQAAAAAWSAASPKILLDVELALAAVVDLNLGYRPDTILMSTPKYAYMASDQTVANLRRREATDNPVYSGTIDVIGGLTVVTAPASALPTNDVWIIDSQQLGGMADEQADAPGYSVDQMAIEVKTMRDDPTDKWVLRGRRLTVPVVQEPGAAIRITGT